MPKIHLGARGIQDIQVKYDKISRDIPQAAVDTTKYAVMYLWGKMEKYPPPPPMSTYRRTGTLGRSIVGEVRPLGGSIVGALYTDLNYAPYVIDDHNQAWMHVGRWWTMQGILRENQPFLVSLFRKNIGAALTGSGLKLLSSSLRPI